MRKANAAEKARQRITKKPSRKQKQRIQKKKEWIEKTVSSSGRRPNYY